MQAVDQRIGSQGIGTYTRVMAGFGTIVAVVLIAIAIAYGAMLVSGTLGSRTTASTASDPLSAPAVVAFRVSEHSETQAALKLDPFKAPGLIQFRNSEKTGASSEGADPLSAPSLVKFRASEHSEAR